MTLKTKDILKILKLVKKSKKAKKRRSKHKKKINITTQQITPSTLQPYEISRQPFNSTNNVQLENLRLNNQVLENKLKEPDSNIKAIEDKLNLAIGYNNINDKVNLTTNSISDIKNDNMELNNKINRVIDFGKNFVAETKRKFDNHQLKIEDAKKKFDNKHTKQDDEKPDEKPVDHSAVFDNPDDNLVDIINPLSTNPFSLDRKASPTEVNIDKVEETKTEEVNPLNTSNVSNIANTEDNFVYKKIKNEKILRALLKNIETKPTRKLTDDEKKLLKGFYKKNNVTWTANTQSTGGVKKQLSQFTL
jgi:ribosomal silencing factor RsfS